MSQRKRSIDEVLDKIENILQNRIDIAKEHIDKGSLTNEYRLAMLNAIIKELETISELIEKEFKHGSS